MADVTINLIDKDGVLYYKTAKMSEYEIVKEDSTVGADPGQTVAWTCADDSIEKIQKIDVNKEKSGYKNWKDFWESKPKKTDSSGKTFEGTIKSDSVDPSDPEYNGYDITYKTPDGKETTVDPDVQIPQG
ncbi:MAG: hypothetical protein R8G66_08325 [Cytophagales bacterium]|nr:hypothetical protein [Cytophagales bacterium]